MKSQEVSSRERICTGRSMVSAPNVMDVIISSSNHRLRKRLIVAKTPGLVVEGAVIELRGR